MRLKKPPRFQGKLQSADELEACRAAGFVLGERYFLSILRQPEFIFHAANFFKMKNDRGILREVRKVLNRRPVRAQGKLERF